MKLQVLIWILIGISFQSKAQFRQEMHLSNENCIYQLILKPNGFFSYEYNVEETEDILGTNIELSGNWILNNDSLMLIDTLFPIGNINRKKYYLKMIDNYTLINHELPECKKGDTLFTTFLADSLNTWFFKGIIKNEKMNGIKWDLENNLQLKIENEIIIDTLN